MKKINLPLAVIPSQFVLFTLFSVLEIAVTFSTAVNSDSEFSVVKVHQVQDLKSGHSNLFYKVQLNTFGKHYELNLYRPEYSIYSPGFKYQEVHGNNSVQNNFVDITPSNTILNSIQKAIFIDPHLKATVNVYKTDDEYRLHGTFSGLTIKHYNNTSHKITKTKTYNHFTSGRPERNRRAITSRLKVSATPEILVFLDYLNTKRFGNDRRKMLEYVGVFFHEVNSFYEDIPDLDIKFRVAGLISVTTRQAQPYMEAYPMPKGHPGYIISKVLTAFEKYITQNKRSLPPHDIPILLTGEDMGGYYPRHRKWANSLVGLSTTGPCVQSKSSGVASEDIGGFFEGAFSTAHELSHVLGTLHDGERQIQDFSGSATDATRCPSTAGYIMASGAFLNEFGYGRKNGYRFSSCSIQAMKNFINSPLGKCVRDTELTATQNLALSNKFTGDYFDMNSICQGFASKRTGVKITDAFADPDTGPNELCQVVFCWFREPGTLVYLRSDFGHSSGNKMRCGNGGYCYRGVCKNQVKG